MSRFQPRSGGPSLFQIPIAHPVDITFLMEEEAKYKTEVEAAANKAKAKKTLN